MAATGIYHVKVGKKRKGIRGMIWRFLPDGGNKIGRIRFSQHNQTGHIACLHRIFGRMSRALGLA